jgi:hypothetical protein
VSLPNREACYLSRMQLRTVTATRYVTPLRQGGSLPAIVEADDDGLYVLKFRGAGQGPRALIAELLGGELARALGLPVPELVFIDLDPDLARTEPDGEVQRLLKASAGLNVALDYLPGSVTFDSVVEHPAPKLASEIVWFDAFVTNVDRTARNTNMLMWQRRLYLIDHGAAFYFHHSWQSYRERATDPFALIKDHVLLRFASELRAAEERMAPLVTPALLDELVALIPDAWLGSEGPFATPAEYRAGYREYLGKRTATPRPFVEEALRARSLLV